MEASQQCFSFKSSDISVFAAAILLILLILKNKLAAVVTVYFSNQSNDCKLALIFESNKIMI